MTWEAASIFTIKCDALRSILFAVHWSKLVVINHVPRVYWE